MIRLAVVDDHPVVRRGLRDIFAGEVDFEVVAVAEDGMLGLVAAMSTRPDVMLVDLSMPTMDGIEATHRITQSCPGTKVILLTSFDGGDRVKAALRAGAVAYLLKTTPTRELVERVRAVAAA